MKKKKMMMKVIAVALAIVMVAALVLPLTGCQRKTKSFGGSMTIELQPNQKLENITWKEFSLWYLTRPMTEEDIAETYTFQQSSEWGILEGTVTIIETKDIDER